MITNDDKQKKIEEIRRSCEDLAVEILKRVESKSVYSSKMCDKRDIKMLEIIQDIISL